MAEKKDIFYLDKVFPEADKVFSETYKSAETIIKDSLIVLDTNVLLVPFDTNEKNVNDIKAIYLNYKNQNRLFIPARVAREFANNRALRIGDVFLQVRQIKENLNPGPYKISQYPILQNNADYNQILEQFESIKNSIKVSRKHLERLESYIQSWTWNDNVSQAYKEIFTPEIILEVKKSKEDLEKELAFRIDYKVAPGFKDSKKPDDGIGDLVIWQTILELAQEKGRDVVFVTNDQKNDWFYKQDKIGLYPKYELFDEFRRITGGKSISIINFIKFLELSNAKEETIQEVKTSIKVHISSEFKKGLNGLTVGMQVEHPKYGIGSIKKLKENGSHSVAEIEFEEYGLKPLLIQYAPLRLLDTNRNFLLQNPDADIDLGVQESNENE